MSTYPDLDNADLSGVHMATSVTEATRHRRPNALLSLAVWLLPHSGLKIRALRLLGHDIGEKVTLAPNLVLGCGRFTIDDGAIIGPFNVFRNLAHLSMKPDSAIGSWNQLTAAAEYQQFSDRVGTLSLGYLAAITNRHYLDCSGQIILHDRAGVGGIKSIFQSHEIDLEQNATTVGTIVVGVNAMTGTACTVLKDAHLPDRSILGAGSLLTKAKPGADMPEQSLYAGVPARAVRHIEDLTWWHRSNYYTPVRAFDDSKFPLP
jgi:acetyltransferase-like isoleucine patch superfamily enzyme